MTTIHTTEKLKSFSDFLRMYAELKEVTVVYDDAKEWDDDPTDKETLNHTIYTLKFDMRKHFHDVFLTLTKQEQYLEGSVVVETDEEMHLLNDGFITYNLTTESIERDLPMVAKNPINPETSRINIFSARTFSCVLSDVFDVIEAS